MWFNYTETLLWFDLGFSWKELYFLLSGNFPLLNVCMMGFREPCAGGWEAIRWVVNGLTRGRIWGCKITDSKLDEEISTVQRTPPNPVAQVSSDFSSNVLHPVTHSSTKVCYLVCLINIGILQTVYEQSFHKYTGCQLSQWLTIPKRVFTLWTC